ncbi:MAG: Gfo/Idh/MocA family oxidoreductase [Spirochaetales bacterium]|jgi:predicted dehydrogenase|nr:Gfo/Idh/MocA family oxidoreductase [Spirochaetales bacterium]
MDKVRIGIIGVGQIAKQHLKTYSEIADAEVIAACDINSAELERVCEQFAIPNSCTDISRMLERDDLDAVDICLHNNLHMPATVAVLESGKHAYCEKPIAGTYADGKKMLDAAEAAGKKLHIQLSTLYASETKAAKTLIDAGEIGAPYHARSTGFRRRGRPYVDGYGSMTFVQKENSGGGAMFDMGVYHIAQLVYLLNLPEVERVSGKVYQEIPLDKTRQAESGYNVEEMGVGLVRFKGGLTLDIVESWAVMLDGFEGSCIIGPTGGIRLDPFSFHSTFNDLDMNSSFDLKYMEYRRHQLGPDGDAYDSSQAHWIAALQSRVNLIPTSKIALSTMLIQEGIYLSDKLGREVSSDEITASSTSTDLKI